MGDGRLNILAIDTSGPVAGCAIWRDGRIVHATRMNHGLTHSETILPAVDEMLSVSGISCNAIDCFCAVVGPGSFTGVRIGVCAVKGLAHAVGKPCCAVNALEALAMNAPGFSGIVCPILDARRDQVYCAAFDTRRGMPERILPDRAMALDAYIASIPEKESLLFVGDGVLPHARELRNLPGRDVCIPHAGILDLRPENACVLAALRQDGWMPAAALEPYYLRAPQAEREREKRLKEK